MTSTIMICVSEYIFEKKEEQTQHTLTDALQIRAIATNCVTSDSRGTNWDFQLFGCAARNQTCFQSLSTSVVHNCENILEVN